MRYRLAHHLSGQSLITVALFALLLFMTVGLAIDGGMIYVQRRLMQNTADTACLAAANRIALNRGSQARNAAIDAIKQNLGDPTPGAGANANAPGTLSYTNIGDVYNNSSVDASGTALSWGIEINGAAVRVGLKSPAYTFFMRVAGIDTYTVGARAHCNSTAGGGATPFAVARWRGYSTSGQLRDGLTTDRKIADQCYDTHPTCKHYIVRDILGEENANHNLVTEWPNWGTSGYPGNPLSPYNNSCCLYSDAAYPASDADTLRGLETIIAGANATPNVGDNSYRGAVVLDYRQVTYPQPLYYNGLSATSNVNTFKERVALWINQMYPGPDVLPGEQLLFFSGASAGQVVKPFNLRYKPGDIVSALIYNGTIYDDPAFDISFPTPASGSIQSRSDANIAAGSDFTSDCSLTPSAYTYGSTTSYNGGTYTPLDPPGAGPGPSVGPARFQFKIDPVAKPGLSPQVTTYRMRAFLSTVGAPSAWGQVKGRWNNSSWLDLNVNGSGPEMIVDPGAPSSQLFNFDLQQAETGECEYVNTSTGITETYTLPVYRGGAQTIYLEAEAENTSKRRAIYGFLNMNGASDDFFVYFPGQLVYQPLTPADTTTPTFNVDTIAGSKLDVVNDTDVSHSFSWYDTNLASVSPPSDINLSFIRQGGDNKLTINVGGSAATGKEYYLGIDITYHGRSHRAWYYIEVREPTNSSANLKQFVYALGYANFKITDVTANDIKGRAISGLLQPSQVKAGFMPRLVPWEQ